MGCAFPLEAVREIVPMATLATPPGLPSGLAGFLDLRGVAIPIARLDRLFDLPEQRPGLNTPMIILRGAAVPIGVLVNYVRCIARVPPNDSSLYRMIEPSEAAQQPRCNLTEI
jgi:chemotaxis signal transduction protein